MKELMKNIDKTALFNCDDLSFKVTIINVRKAYGRIDYEIKPIDGNGKRWVSSDRLEIAE